MTRTFADLLAAQLRRLGVRRLWGPAPPDLPGIGVQRVDDPDIALLLAEADGRLGPGLGGAWLGGAILHLTNSPGATSPLVPVGDGVALVDALAAFDAIATPSAIGLQISCELGEEVDGEASAESTPRQVVAVLDPALADLYFLIVAGPGVLRAGAAAELGEAAATLGCGDVNTWGGKGLFRWDSPFHFGTAGLQTDDFALAGLGEAEVVITTGLDPDESPPSVFADAAVQDVHPSQLAALTYRWTERNGPPDERPELYRALAAVVTPLYERNAAPLSAPRAALHLSGARPDGGLVVADAGQAGFWVARTFPTGDAGSVIVPATSQRGFAAAAAHVASVDGRPAVAVVDDIDAETAAVLEFSTAVGVGYGVQVWATDSADTNGTGAVVDPDEHATRTLEVFEGRHDGPVIDHVEVDGSGLDALIDVAGPIVAWGGRRLQ